MSEEVTISASVPRVLKRRVYARLALDEMPFRQWLIMQMQTFIGVDQKAMENEGDRIIEHALRKHHV